MKLYSLLLVLICVTTISCDDDVKDTSDGNNPTELYFPPIGSDTWETVSLSELEWNENNLQPLLNFVNENNSKAFVVLQNGRIAIEWYADDFSSSENWYWASAGKTLTSTTVGIAEQNRFLDINNSTNSYLGDGWTNTIQEQEDNISVINQLTMTSGLNDLIFDCTDSNCLLYKADASTRWAYHDAPYTLLQEVLANATNIDFENYFNDNLRDKIGMNGGWFSTNDYNNVYFSTARSMARFGLLMLNSGEWDTQEIINTNYFDSMTNTSQSLNKSYGYLWWLNGKESYMLPETQTVFNKSLIENAPDDLFAGLGKNDQKLYVVPSLDLVVIRMGDAAIDDSLVPINFDNELWDHINNVIHE